MKRHLYNLVKVCSATIKDIEFTDEIKEYILANRVYNPAVSAGSVIKSSASSSTAHTLNQTINYINTTNNFIANMSFHEKLSQYIHHTDKQIIPIDEFLALVFKPKIDRLERLPNSFILDSTDFLSMVNTASSPATVDRINIMYDFVTTHIHIFRNNKWELYIEEKGINEIMRCIQEVMYDVYECYLIKKLNAFDKDGRHVQRLPFEELLIDYYKFIAIFDLEPYIKDKTNSDILNNGSTTYGSLSESESGSESGSSDSYDRDEDTAICDKYYPKYLQAQNTVTIRVCKENKKRVLDIVKRNFKASLDMLNKEVANLFRMDEEFKAKLSMGIIGDAADTVMLVSDK